MSKVYEVKFKISSPLLNKTVKVLYVGTNSKEAKDQTATLITTCLIRSNVKEGAVRLISCNLLKSDVVIFERNRLNESKQGAKDVNS